MRVLHTCLCEDSIDRVCAESLLILLSPSCLFAISIRCRRRAREAFGELLDTRQVVIVDAEIVVTQDVRVGIRFVLGLVELEIYGLDAGAGFCDVGLVHDVAQQHTVLLKCE